MQGVREKYDEIVNQTCTKLIITIDVRWNDFFFFLSKE
jgi:hypothetical protein